MRDVAAHMRCTPRPCCRIQIVRKSQKRKAASLLVGGRLNDIATFFHEDRGIEDSVLYKDELSYFQQVSNSGLRSADDALDDVIQQDCSNILICDPTISVVDRGPQLGKRMTNLVQEWSEMLGASETKYTFKSSIGFDSQGVLSDGWNGDEGRTSIMHLGVTRCHRLEVKSSFSDMLACYMKSLCGNHGVVSHYCCLERWSGKNADDNRHVPFPETLDGGFHWITFAFGPFAMVLCCNVPAFNKLIDEVFEDVPIELGVNKEEFYTCCKLVSVDVHFLSLGIAISQILYRRQGRMVKMCVRQLLSVRTAKL